MDDEEEMQEYGPETATGNIARALSEIGAQYTTPQARELATRTFNELYTERGQHTAEENEAVAEMEQVAAQAKAALRAARERLLASRYGQAEKYLAVAAGLGSTTKSGSAFENLGDVARNLQAPIQNERKFNMDRDKSVLDNELDEGSIDSALAKARIEIAKGRRTAGTDLMKETLKILGKETRPVRGAPDRAQEAVDRLYAKDYVEFIQTGASESTKAIGELKGAAHRLRGKQKGGKDILTGPIVGSLATLPVVGKALQDVLNPESADVREVVEYTVQQSLRPILGAQFTEKEGERLIARVFNPRLEEHINGARVARLVQMIERAHEEKTRAARYFEQHGTLKGFKGRTHWNKADIEREFFDPFAQNAGAGTVLSDGGADDGMDLDDEPAADPAEIVTIDQLTPAQRDALRRQYPDQKFAEGGPVRKRVLVRLPDGSVVPLVDEAAPVEAVDEFEDESGGDGPDLAASVGKGAALGAAAGAVAAPAGAAAVDAIPGVGLSPAERRIIQGLQQGEIDPATIANELRGAQRRGVPAMALDVGGPEARGLVEAALSQAGNETNRLVEDLGDRQGGARGRVDDQLNQGLAPDEFFAQERQFRDKLYTQAKPMYDRAYAQFPALKSKTLSQLMNTPSGAKAVKRAVLSMRDRPGANIGKVDAMGMISRPSLEFLDQVKRELDDMISVSEGKKATGKGKSLRTLRNALRAEMDALTVAPGTGKSPYHEARMQYAGDLEVLDALQQGRKEFARMPPNQLKAVLDDMSFAEKDAFRNGAYQRLTEILEEPASDINAARRLVGSPAMRKRLEVLIDDPKKFKILDEALQMEMDMFDKSKGMLQRGEAARALRVNPELGVAQRAAKAAPAFGLLSPVHWVLKVLRETPDISAKEAQGIVRILRTKDPKVMDAFQKRFDRAKGRKGRAGKVAGLGALIGGGIGYLTGQDQDAGEVDPTLEGLTEEEIVAAKTPAFARGGQVRRLKIDALARRLGA